MLVLDKLLDVSRPPRTRVSRRLRLKAAVLHFIFLLFDLGHEKLHLFSLLVFLEAIEHMLVAFLAT